MSRGEELIKKIDEHIKNAGGLYGLELSDSDLGFIKKVLEVREDLVNTGELDNREYCPSCGKRIRGKYCIGGRTFTPPFCCLCGKPLEPEEGDSES